MKNLSIVGYGAFTKLMIDYLQDDFNILVYSRNPGSKDKGGRRFNFATLDNVLQQEIIIISLPAQYIGEFLRVNGTSINPDALVLDVASVKELPIKDMRTYLPKSCQIIGTHPIFGPGSAAKDITGLRIVRCPERCNPQTLAKLKEYLERKCLIVLEKTPEEHDRAMAYVLGLTQYIGRALQQIGAHDTELTTPAYVDLMDMKAIQGTDSWDLFYSVMSCNRYTEDVIKQLRGAFDMLDDRLSKF
ncbi:prephenate dehydrogenase/arogenate dehydrogenase family protein [soil metagenome]